MSDTPRTDSEARFTRNRAEVVRADFARQLERELATANLSIARLRAQLDELKDDDDDEPADEPAFLQAEEIAEMQGWARALLALTGPDMVMGVERDECERWAVDASLATEGHYFDLKDFFEQRERELALRGIKLEVE